MPKLLAVCVLAVLSCVGSAAAQTASDYPSRLIRLVVPYPPGGSTDPVARLVAEDLKKQWGQPVVVDNRGGAAGSIGTDVVAKSAGDGYTILFHTSVISTDPSFKKHTPYNVRKDLVPVAQVATGPYLLVVPPKSQLNSVNELITFAKAHPGKLNFGSAGVGSSGHLIGELFKLSSGLNMVHVPFRGGGPSIQALMGGDIDLVFDTVTTSRTLVEGGQLKALAVTGPARSPLMPNVPTMAEAGMPGGFEQVYWLGFFAPAGTPEDIVNKLAAGITAALTKPEVRERIASLGLLPKAVGPKEFKVIVDTDIEKWRKVIQDAKIEPE